MNKKEIKALREQLLEYRSKVSGDINHLASESLNVSQKDASGDLSSYTFHMADVATDNWDREFNLGLASSEQEILKRVDRALKKMDDNTYGTCEDCDDQIPVARLRAMPFAALCIQCQEKMEQQGR